MTVRFVALAGVAPEVLIDPEHPHSVETVRVGNQDPTTLGRDRCDSGVARNAQRFADTRATVRCWQTIPSSAQRSAPRVSLARGSAALLCPDATRARNRSTGAGRP